MAGMSDNLEELKLIMLIYIAKYLERLLVCVIRVTIITSADAEFVRTAL